MRANGALLVFSLILLTSGFQVNTVDARIIVGVSTVNLAFLPIYVTQEKGYFKNEGLDVLVVMFNAGSTNLQALIGGDVQIMAGAVPESVLGRASGIDIKNFWAISNVMPFQLYSHPSLKTIKEAKGKKFAISRFGSLTDFLTRASLRHFGMDPKEVTILQIGATPARFAALSSGAVDATVVWFPVTERAKSMGFRQLLDLKEIFPEWSNVGFIGRETWLGREKEQVIRFLRAYQRGVKYTRDNRADAINTIKKYVKVDSSEAQAGYDEYRDSYALDGRIFEKGLTAVIDQEFETGRIKRKIPPGEMVDRTFMNLLGK